MSNRIEQIKQHLNETRAALNAALDRVGEQGDQPIYSEGANWTLRQLVIHLALADQGHNQMVFHYAKDEPFIPENYDIERYNKSSVQKNAEMTLSEARALLAASREALIAWLDQLEDASVLDKTGRHPNLQIIPITDILMIQGEHERIHARDIIDLLENS